jgi:hypothetical protein
MMQLDSDYSLFDERNGLEVIDIPNLTIAQRRGMLALLQTCYANVSATQFNNDLDEKEWTILGTEPESGRIWCFSTMRRLRATIDGNPITAFYSGDTASRADTRGAATAAGTRLVIRKMFYEMMFSSEEGRFYWFMISSTYKSYRLLPMIFRDFAPGPGRNQSGREKRIIVEVSRLKGFDYDPSSGIVKLANPTLPLESAAEIDAPREQDPYASFFRSANPRAHEGDRLAALTEVSLSNLTPLGTRMVSPAGDLATQPATQPGRG